MTSTQQKVIRNKVGLLRLAEELGNVSRACQVMGYSRDTFYRYKQAAEEGGFNALVEQSRKGRPNLRNRTAPEIEETIVALATDEPALGQVRVSNELRKKGMQISAAGVRCVWQRHGLETMKKRLFALEKKVAEEGLVLTEAQVAALEKKRSEEEACGEIETAYPGFLGSQDTFYVGHLKGVGRIYQQTFVDTYAKVAHAKLYTNKTPMTAADLLNDRVLPFFEEHGITVERMLTDRGTEFCGRHDSHPYELFLAVSDIDHTKTKVKSPQTNGICERFHRTVLEEFYQVTFRKKIYRSLEELQTDLDEWLRRYNEERTHQGKMCCGRTPMQTFLDGLNDWRDKHHGHEAA
jgi:transposase InsO family protein